MKHLFSFALVLVGLVLGIPSAVATTTSFDFKNNPALIPGGGSFGTGETPLAITSFTANGFTFSGAHWSYFKNGASDGLRIYPQAGGLTVRRLDGKPFSLDSFTVNLGGSLLADPIMIVTSCLDANCVTTAIDNTSYSAGNANINTFTGNPSLKKSVYQLTFDLSGLYQLQSIIFTSGLRMSTDFNGDGRSDLFWRSGGVNGSGQNFMWEMNGLSTLSGSGFLATVADTNWQVAGTADLNGDGLADVVWRNAQTGENYVWLMNGMTVATGGYLRTIADKNWQIAAVSDVDGDGKSDIVWHNDTTHENYLWLMNGLTIKAEGYLPTVADQNWQIVVVSDVNGDGKSDILWHNTTTLENYVWLMNGLTAPVGGFLPTVADKNWQIAGAGDVDTDGKADLVWRNAATGENYLWIMNGTAVSASAFLPAVASADWHIASIVDVDGDGNADLVWRNIVSGENYLWLMSGQNIAASGYLPTVADATWQVKSR